jgi:hypothetical protein
MIVKPEGKRKKGRPRMRWMAGWYGDGFKELGCSQLESKGSSEGWVEKVYRADQDPQRVLMPIIIIGVLLIIKITSVYPANSHSIDYSILIILYIPGLVQ